MALNITSSITSSSGVVLNGAYGRIQVLNNVDGAFLQGILNIYSSKEAFNLGYQPIPFNLETYLKTPYQREVHGVDTLDLCHTAFINMLASKGITATKDLS